MVAKLRAFSWSKSAAEFAPRINAELAPEGTRTLGNGPLFWLCMTVGFVEGKRGKPSTDQDVGRVPEILTPEASAAAHAIALEVLGIQSWNDENEVLSLAEEFAAGGLEILASQLDNGVREWVAERFYPAISNQLTIETH
jgi:hypothetical protein